jgi:hypothetical protein
LVVLWLVVLFVVLFVFTYVLESDVVVEVELLKLKLRGNILKYMKLRNNYYN